MQSIKCIGKCVVGSEKLILIGKVGELKRKSDDSENDADTNERNELIFAQKSFVIREELNASELKCDVPTHHHAAFTFSIVMEGPRETLYLAYRPNHLVWRMDEFHIDRLVRAFFILNNENALDFPNYESDHFDVEEIQRIENGDAANSERNVETIDTDMVSELYRRLRQAHFERDQLITTDATVQHAAMSATLKSYQATAVRWMLHRELCPTEVSMNEQVIRRWPPNKDDGEKFFYNPYRAEFSNGEKPMIQLPSGGILADEMGLGKTVEALALILLNKRPANDLIDDNDEMENVERNELDDSEDDDDDDLLFIDPSPSKRRKMNHVSVKCICTSSKITALDKLIKCSKCALRQHRRCVLKHAATDISADTYICPECWNYEKPIKTSATIIVSPRSIKMQWLDEIRKHINDDNFKVFLYDGARYPHWINPIDLATYHLVLIDYETMSSELKFAEASKVKRIHRAPPRYIKPISPLLKLEWWRVCLDEAQMVHSGINSAAQLVAQLPTIHRWAITGTPIDKSINDLFGLFCFLNLVPYNYAPTFRSVHQNFTSGENDELIAILWRVMWRTCKSMDILNEIAIPKQTEIVHFITPSDLELYFYNEQFLSCYQAFQEKANKLAAQQEKQLLSSLSPHVLKLLMEPLRKLRQDCSMPSILQKNDQRINKSLLKPDDLLQHLISNTEIKTKSEIRTIGSSLNGLAALLIIQNKYDDAIGMYKKVLRWAADYTGNISVDSLLQVHALHNLLAIGTHLPQDERDKYAKQLQQMEQKYIEPSAQLVAKVKNEKNIATDRVEECKQNFVADEYTWWNAMLAHSDDIRTDQLMVRIFLEVMEKEPFSNSRGLSLALTKWLDDLNAERDGVHDIFEKLTYLTDNLKALSMLDEKLRQNVQALIDRALDCHLDPNGGRRVRNQRKKTKLCELCLAKQQLQKYERYIQPEKKNDRKSGNIENEDDELRKRVTEKKTWTLSKMEMILRIIQSQARQFELGEDMLNDAKNHLKLMEALHNEFTELSQLWVEANHTVSLYDEIEMCKSRLMVYDPIEIGMDKLPANTANLYVSKYEIAETMHTVRDQMNQAELEFVRKMGRLKYLNHLKKSNELENCPICCHQPEEKYVVLECGHHMCMVCAIQWMETTAAGLLTCSICRHKQRKKNLYYVTLRSNKNMTDSSSKIEQIVQTIIKLKEDEERVKIVIFSHWPDILKILEDALYENEIEFKQIRNINTFAMTLRQFKDPTQNVTCLLLPLKCGAKGLNLTEATHIFLVEPILNPGEQLQAIGRIHRMGQTRPTFVHRFIVKNTIEETIHEQSKCDIWSFKNWTIDNLRKLFRGKDNNEPDHTGNVVQHT